MSKTKTTEEIKVETETEAKKASPKTPKKKVISGTLSIDATFNNTKVLLADKTGNTLFWSSAGSLGFRGAKKGTPFAASKVGDIIGGKAAMLGIKDVNVVVMGVGSGREPAIRAFMAHGMEITSVADATPVPHNGPKAKKPRRV
ncbi:30S ribosomal protein S11 [Candidatus Nomurabacteria bacterium RIFCSPHIGHO2_01_FULL_37_25]|uniref:Small ribosomal subunit protein uS11 n=1 Tax=Candidatus Nomurabacteria bacterium RIFCSPLOWO2_01_FULL_36_16 TaxID=1801767 RepID=A0A1F6WY29_9BACT|nr:MAG: 30S ribosomal protein S11 [Candidatus Nomurabacteria bacterium RIFCSPHIGHO2_01_FULL_37_25]OGI75125.1 MAG: 30S ribosomal protein S11 [Candidatus Nomurabacteria bacterium RIFCSPHIGHO2_02_FULL_36_29]OGI86780.1 MAG: 30S ribosomal protein S11 [Candidatus Nomurabacteria bacterium RIFCSPLOWO2_01_FULL_36_16]OGI96446.1 MAG: 30S ribosomal protein S11 [Candidatus Nomurabacteria bacterium RIFCSPLOWO2_02_FULL_36_8]